MAAASPRGSSTEMTRAEGRRARPVSKPDSKTDSQPSPGAKNGEKQVEDGEAHASPGEASAQRRALIQPSLGNVGGAGASVTNSVTFRNDDMRCQGSSLCAPQIRTQDASRRLEKKKHGSRV